MKHRIFRIAITIFLMVFTLYQCWNPRTFTLSYSCEMLKNDPLFQFPLDGTVTFPVMLEWVIKHYGVPLEEISQISPNLSGMDSIGWSFERRRYDATLINNQLQRIDVSWGHYKMSSTDLVSCMGNPSDYMATVRQDSVALAGIEFVYASEQVRFSGTEWGGTNFQFNPTFDFEHLQVRYDGDLYWNGYEWAEWKSWNGWNALQVDIDPVLMN